ncbi:MAG TPA: serine/threonine-protein kinase [Polyangiaceae bacterium]|nr:serine/threonine-protein kinase [Polyangiaceae bacterium]
MQIGDQIAGRYRLIRPLAAGGMGEVWAARNELTGRDFAIKFLLKEFAHSSEAFERFVREAEIAGKLQHPSVVDVFDIAQTEEGRPFIVMELLAGEDLEAALDRKGTLSPLRMAAILSQVATGLALAHAAGVVHRDLSASNIFLARNSDGGEPIPKILDFGVSKRVGPNFDGQSTTSNGAVLGNPVYMSPEQAMGAETVDARTDVWALGVVMYQCLTGTVPFRSNNYNALMVDIMTRPHRPILQLMPALDAEIADIIEQCLQKERELRFGSAQELGTRLASIARRLAGDPKTLTRSPRRRATDRLPPPPTRAERLKEARRAFAALPLGVRAVRAVASLRPPRSVIATSATIIGALIGVFVSQWWQKADVQGSSERASMVQAALPSGVIVPQDDSSLRLAESAPESKASQFNASKSSTEQRLRRSTSEIRLGQAVARGLKGRTK